MRLTQAILPVAGLGTRFLPWTKVVPKEMLPVGRLPIIALLVDECISVGITEICFVISRGKEVIPQFFAQDKKLEGELRKRGKSEVLDELLRYDSVKFETVYQDEQRGDGHALLSARDFVKSDAVAVLFGDDLIVGKENGLQQMVRQKAEMRGQRSEMEYAMLCLQDVPREHVSRYGIASVEPAEGRLKRVTGLVEKPAPEKAPSTLAIVGKYIIPRSLFSVFPTVAANHPSTGLSPSPAGFGRAGRTGSGEIRIIDALIASLSSLPVYGYVFEGRRFDTGTPEGYRETVLALG